MSTNRRMNLAEYLWETYGIQNSSVGFSRHVRPLYAKLLFRPAKHQILIQGLIGMALGSYALHDQRMMELADETIEKYSPLI